MKNGILREDEGYDLLVDGVPRSFSDDEPGAMEMARELKRSNRNSIIEIRTRLDGTRRIMLEDGRLG